MNILFQIASVITFITLVLFVMLYVINIKKDTTPNQKAVWATFSGAFLLIYILFDLFIASIAILPPHNFFFLFFAVFALIPFVIGRLAVYETLKKYLFIQISALTLNLLTFLIMLFV